MRKVRSVLVLEGGRRFEGSPLGYKGVTRGELCFTTSMGGYQHSISDPSFAGQVLLFTFPHVGIVGINDLDTERRKLFLRGVVLREIPSDSYHFQSGISLNKWLEDNEVVGICEVDTRALTHQIRKNGCMKCIIVSDVDAYDSDFISSRLKECPDIKGSDLTKEITDSGDVFPGSDKELDKKTIVIIDFGLKGSMHDLIRERYNVVVVSAKPGFAEEVIKHSPDGILLSNGPGDPGSLQHTLVPEIKKLISLDIPIFAICLGHQLLLLAYGCSTIKMHHGHRGVNHPVYCVESKRILITSHNHGFMVDPTSLSSELEVTHRSLFDGCIEGVKVKGKPTFSVQYHPEASPGTSDASCLFERFYSYVG